MRTKTIRMCRHCHRRRVNRSRGLCWACYYNPTISDRYATAGGRGRRGICVANESPPPCAMPTAAIPGTEDKVAVLCERAEAGVALWHPLDRS